MSAAPGCERREGRVFRIRSAEPADFEAIAALTNHFIRETAIHFGYEPVSAQELRSAWEGTRDRYPYLVAVDEEERFLAYAKAGLWRERAAYRRTAETGIYVEASARGTGIGTALYRALIEACREAGFHTLVGGLTLPNDASARLHERLGFRHAATFHEVGWKFERWHDVAFYELVLGDANSRRPSPSAAPSPETPTDDP